MRSFILIGDDAFAHADDYRKSINYSLVSEEIEFDGMLKVD
jgi:hypothetical protein